MNVGNLSSGYESSVPCTPLGCYLMIKKIEPNLSGKKAVACKSSKKRTTSVSKSWSPGMADLRGRASYIIQKQTNARTIFKE
jgi:hypothetical protein